MSIGLLLNFENVITRLPRLSNTSDKGKGLPHKILRSILWNALFFKWVLYHEAVYEINGFIIGRFMAAV